MNETRRMIIDAEAEKLIKKIRGATLFGEPITLDDLNMMIVATKYLVEGECYAKKAKGHISGSNHTPA